MSTSTSTSSPQIWFITGCSAGLGLALTRYAQLQGHTVIASSRDPSRTPELVSEVENRGGKWLTLDTGSSEAQIKETIHHAESLFGHIDILVNNAAYTCVGPLEEIPDDEVQAQMQVNFFGRLRIMQAVVPGMRKQGSGVIVNISSTQGFVHSPACGIYAASKAALEAVSETSAAELAPFGIRVLIIEPGAMKTSFAHASVARVIQPSKDYSGDHPVSTWLGLIEKFGSGSVGGDPIKYAGAIFDMATGEGEVGGMIKKERLLRIALGPSCWTLCDGKVQELRRTLDLVKDVAHGVED